MGKKGRNKKTRKTQEERKERDRLAEVKREEQKEREATGRKPELVKEEHRGLGLVSDVSISFGAGGPSALETHFINRDAKASKKWDEYMKAFNSIY